MAGRPGRLGVGHDDAAVADTAGGAEEVLRRLAPLAEVLVQLWGQRPGKWGIDQDPNMGKWMEKSGWTMGKILVSF